MKECGHFSRIPFEVSVEIFKELGPQLHILLWKLKNGFWSTGVLKPSRLPLPPGLRARARAVCAGSGRARRRWRPGRVFCGSGLGAQIFF